MVNVPSGLNNLKAKVDDLDVNKLKNVPGDLNKLSALVIKEVVKKTKFNKLNTKINNLELKIPGTTRLIPINQYNTDTQNLEKKLECIND